MLRRPRRNRKSPAIRSLLTEARLSPENFVAPFILTEGEKINTPTLGLEDLARKSIDVLLREAEYLHSEGVQAIALFPCIHPEKKDDQGSYALDEDGLIPRAIQTIKAEIPSLCIFADVALDPYTTHGHDGLINENGYVINDASVQVLAQQALVLAQAGVDVVAPSDMMDGRVGAIRQTLDQNGFIDTNICAYSAKYTSAFYGPYRTALGSAPQIGDKKSYQMNPANRREAMIEAQLDSGEGADMLLVKPALSYLDVISAMRGSSPIPICAFHVSGEYAMIMAAGNAGYLDADAALYEVTLSIKRAGADVIFTYGAKKLIELLKRDIAQHRTAALV
ncbi:MAG: porphobilinogen synthase [Chlamydiales bacterium]|nr:porphobilinogen synthase [Chlamydiales bacterium]